MPLVIDVALGAIVGVAVSLPMIGVALTSGIGVAVTGTIIGVGVCVCVGRNVAVGRGGGVIVAVAVAVAVRAGGRGMFAAVGNRSKAATFISVTTSSRTKPRWPSGSVNSSHRLPSVPRTVAVASNCVDSLSAVSTG